MKRRTQKMCQVCKKSFYGSTDNYYCPACARGKKLDTVIRIRICQDCGVEFFGGPRAKKCPDCSYKTSLEASKKHRKTGINRSIGSTDTCPMCGQEYVVHHARQKYCSESCAREGLLEWQREHKKGYYKKSGQDIKKKEKRNQQQKICIYCLRPFKSSTTTNLCSAYCKSEHRKLLQCQADIKRGLNRNLKKYEDRRDKYREECRNDR